jgi:hypothetical protein
MGRSRRGAGTVLKLLLESQGVILLLDVHAVVFVRVPILHYHHGFMADAAGRETSLGVSGIVALLATSKTVSLGYVSCTKGDPKRAAKKLWKDLT